MLGLEVVEDTGEVGFCIEARGAAAAVNQTTALLVVDKYLTGARGLSFLEVTQNLDSSFLDTDSSPFSPLWPLG